MKKQPLILIDKAVRGDLEFFMEIGTDWQGETLHCYVSFNNESGKLTGNSLYVGAVEFV